MILIYHQSNKKEKTWVSVPMRGFNDFNYLKGEYAVSAYEFPSPCGVLMILMTTDRQTFTIYDPVSVPMRGFNDFNWIWRISIRILLRVSVPMRGFNDFNECHASVWMGIFSGFPSPCGVLMILIKLGNKKQIRNKKFPSPCGVLMILIAIWKNHAKIIL